MKLNTIRPRLCQCLLLGFLCGIGFPSVPLSAQELTASPPPLSPTPAPVPGAPLPPVVARYEQMLAASPAKGTAFDKVYQHFFEGAGLDALAARWQARAAAAGPNAESFLLLQGLLAERRAHPADARALYTQYAAVHPNDPRGWTALGELETSEGRFGPSAAAFAHALAPASAPPVPVAARPALYRALARAQARDFLVAASLSTWRKLASEFPDDPGVLQEVGEAFQEGEAPDEALATFEKVRDLARGNNDAFGRVNATLRMGQVEEARGRAKEAVAIYEGVVSEAKTGSWLEREARARIEQLYRGQEDLPGLADYYQKSLEDHPRDVEVATRRAAVLIELNRKDEAIHLLQAAVAWAPGKQELQVELARRLGEASRPAESAAVMERLTAIAPEEKSYWQLLGDARWQLLESLPANAPAADKAKLKTDALAAWNFLSPADGKDAAATGQLADLLASHRLTDEALAQYSRAAAQAPDLPDPRERWAAFLAQIDRKAEARQIVAGLVTATPKSATAANYGRLANALDRLDDPDGALDATAKGLALDPRNFDLLSQRWQLLTVRKRWDDAVAMYPALLAAAPNLYFVEQVQARHVTALQAAGKLADTRRALAARLGHGTPPLDEGELGLLIRADLQAGNTTIATTETTPADDPLAEGAKAITEGRARFPRAAVLVRLQGELAKRARDPEGQVKALRQLIELLPAQRTDALTEIARVWRDADRLDAALAAARELVAASPAGTAPHLLLSDLLLQAGQTDEGVATLRDAVRLSDKPNEIRLRLARVEGDLGRNADARQALDEAFEAAGDAHERLTLMRPLTQAYQRDNKLDELITRFQRLQGGETDGWRYALYLSELYQETQDFGAARRELAKALAARPKDATLLRQLVRLSGQEQNGTEVVRYQTLLAEVEPSDQNQLNLVEVMLENGQADAALAALRAHLPAILKISGAWDQLLPLLARNDLSAKAGELLTATLGGPGADTRSRFTLALFQAVAGNLDQARTAFWSVFDAKTPRPVTPPSPASKPPGPTAPVSPMVYQLLSSVYSGDSTLDQRFREGQQARNTAQGLLTPAGLGGAGYYGRGFRGFRGGASYNSLTPGGTPSALPNAPDPADTARDAALIYLAALAIKDNSAPQFLDELTRHLDARASSRADRLVAYALVNATDPLLREIAAQVQTPEEGLDPFCLSRVIVLGYSFNNGRAPRDPDSPAPSPERIATLVSLFEPLLARRVAADPSLGRDQTDPLRYSFFQSLDRKEQAEAIRRQAIARVDARSSLAQLAAALPLLLDGDFSAPERARLREICAVWPDTEARSGGSGSPVGNMADYYPLTVFGEGNAANKLPPVDFAEVLADLVPLWYPPASLPASALATGGGNGSLAFSGYARRRATPSIHDENYLPANRFFDAGAMQKFETLAGRLSQSDPARLPALQAQLARQAGELPAARRIYPRLLGVYLNAWTDANADALAGAKTLLAETPDDGDLRLLTAVLLGENERPLEALALLKDLDKTPVGESALNVQLILFHEAVLAKDADATKVAAARLSTMRLSQEERTSVAEELKTLGLDAEAEKLAQSAPATPAPAARRASSSNRPHTLFDFETAQQLQIFMNKKDDVGALALARNVLAALPPPVNPNSPYGDNSDYVLRSVVSAVKQFKRRDDFVADAEKQLAKDPDSVTLNYQLAVLNQDDQGDSNRHAKRLPGTYAAHSPVWLKLKRDGEEVVGLASDDGTTWSEVNRAKFPASPGTLAALALGGSSETAGTFDHVNLDGDLPPANADAAASTPSPADGVPTGGTLPAPWRELPLWRETSSDESDPPSSSPPATWRDGTWTLHDASGPLRPQGRDHAHLVVRPLDNATEIVARIPSLEGVSRETELGIQWRAGATSDAPYVGLVLSGGQVSFQQRDQGDQAAYYWRRLIALRPKDTHYVRILAHWLSEHGARDEAVELYDRLIDTDPDTAFGNFNELSTIYRGARMAGLAERLLAWKPKPPGPANLGRNPYAYSFFQVARECAERKRPDLVIALCQRGIELDNAVNGSGSPNMDMFKLLLTTFVETGRLEEARQALVSFYLPPAEDKTAAAVPPTELGFRNPAYRNRNQSNWLWNLSWNVDSVDLYGLAPLEIVRPAGLLPSLRDALAERRAADPKKFTADGLDWLLTLVRVDARDPAVLDELPAALNARPGSATTGSGVIGAQAEVAARLGLARRLAQWTGHEELALEAFRSARRAASAGNSGFNYAGALPSAVSLQEARGELQLDDPRSALATLRDLAGRIKSQFNQHSGRNPEEAKRCLDLLLRCGPDADALYTDLLDRSTRENKTSSNSRDLDLAYGLEKSLRTGDDPHYQAMGWLLGDGGNPDPASPNATLVYELRVQRPRDKGARDLYPTSRGRSFPGSEGERTLTFSYGPDPGHTTPIGQLKTTATFGTWTGPVPPGSGVLKVTVDVPREKDAVALAAATPAPSPTDKNARPSPTPDDDNGNNGESGDHGRPSAVAQPPGDYWLRIVRSPNLMINPDFDGLANRSDTAKFSLDGWKDLPAGFWRLGHGDNPFPGKPYVQSDAFPREQRTIYGTRVPVEKGRAYFQSGWVRDGGEGSAFHLGRRYLDAEGHVLKSTECPEFSALTWRCHSQRLLPKSDGKDSDSIPARTAFIEPFIRFQGTEDWTGLFLGRMD